jgi:small subunit ribosomal protein S1
MDGIDLSEQTNTTDEEVSTGVADEATPSQSAPATTVADADEELDAASLMEKYLSDPSHDYKSLKYGDVMEGLIMHVDRDELLVDIGSKSEGVIPSREYSSMTSEEKDALKVGDSILVFVVQPENQEGHPVVSIDRARQEKSWRRLQELYEANEVIEAEVTNYNKGGLLVNLDGVRGFVPASQVTEIRGGDEASKQADMARLIGSKLALKVIEINRHRNRLILSERQAVQERRDVMKEKLIEELKEGEVRNGRVSSICDFGAFVDIGGADGLVHLSELSWSRVRHPSEVLKVGQEVEVHVLGINAQEKKIALSIKRTQAEPWSRVASKYEVGQLVRGTVTQLANFGAFARIEDGIEGLIHVSELVDDRITHPKQVVAEGQDLLLRIIRIDPQRRRMGLSLRRAIDTPESDLLGVFGENALEERDALIEVIRQRLDGEGIELGNALQTGGLSALPDPEEERSESRESRSEASLGDITPTPREWVDPKIPPTERRKERVERPKAASTDLPSDMGGEMSAMELAFAMAGAQADLTSDDSSDDAEASSENGESTDS